MHQENLRIRIWAIWPLQGQIGLDLANFGPIWPNINFEAGDFKFVSEVGFHASRKPKGWDLDYLTSNGPNVGQTWPTHTF